MSSYSPRLVILRYVVLKVVELHLMTVDVNLRAFLTDEEDSLILVAPCQSSCYKTPYPAQPQVSSINERCSRNCRG